MLLCILIQYDKNMYTLIVGPNQAPYFSSDTTKVLLMTSCTVAVVWILFFAYSLMLICDRRRQTSASTNSSNMPHERGYISLLPLTGQYLTPPLNNHSQRMSGYNTTNAYELPTDEDGYLPPVATMTQANYIQLIAATSDDYTDVRVPNNPDSEELACTDGYLAPNKSTVSPAAVEQPATTDDGGHSYPYSYADAAVLGHRQI